MPEKSETEVTSVAGALQEILDRRVRLVLYVLAFLILLALTAWQGAEGNWLTAVTTFLTSLAPVLAAANISPKPEILLIPGDTGPEGPKGDQGRAGYDGVVDPEVLDMKILNAVELYSGKHLKDETDGELAV
nr:MAG TPA_asm: Pulmonary surfactant-associated protein D, c-type lectin, alpha-helical coiled [Caudoviricetes sp.]